MQIGNSNKVGIAILISDKINFKTKAIKKDKEGHYIVINQHKRRILYLLAYMCPICACVVKSLQMCLTLRDPMDCNLPGSSVHGISPEKNIGVGCHALLQGFFQPRNRTHISYVLCIDR